MSSTSRGVCHWLSSDRVPCYTPLWTMSFFGLFWMLPSRDAIVTQPECKENVSCLDHVCWELVNDTRRMPTLLKVCRAHEDKTFDFRLTLVKSRWDGLWSLWLSSGQTSLQIEDEKNKLLPHAGFDNENACVVQMSESLNIGRFFGGTSTLSKSLNRNVF